MASHLSFVNILARGGFLLQLFFVLSSSCLGEELEPRQWAHIPIDTNFIGSGYGYTQADIDFDPVLKIENGQMEMHTWAARYIRSFALFEKTARIDLLQTYQEGRWTGLLDGVPATVRRSGWSDTNLRFAINLYGSPPLQGKEYAAYRAAAAVETIVGAGLSVQLPTGDYMDDKLINLGTNRFTFRPQFGVVHSWGNWSLEATGLVALYTDNNEFYNGNKLEQDPLYIIHSHLIYTFRAGVWAGASGGYDYGGRSTVNGIRKDDLKQDLAWAFSFGFPVSRHLGAKMSYVGIRTQEPTGSDSDTYIVGLSAFW
ncbi:MAG: transporter [Desulfobulbales bacterium]